MDQVSFENVSLRDISLESLPRLKRLRDVHFDTRPEVCTEFASLMTEYMQRPDSSSDSSEIQAAKRLKYVMENKKPIIHDDDLLAGTTTTKIKGIPIYPQFLGQAIWPELETISTRKRNPYGITQEEIDKISKEAEAGAEIKEDS